MVLTGVNFADKENTYMETKHSLIKCFGDLAAGKSRTGLDIHFGPAWRKSIISNNRTEHVQRSNSEWEKKKKSFMDRWKDIIVQFMWVLQASCGWMSR